MSGSLLERVGDTLERIRENGLYKNERVITSPQSGCINVPGGEGVLNLCANNYLGLANHPEIITAAKQALDKWGYGMASVRFICGTQEIHKQLLRERPRSLGVTNAGAEVADAVVKGRISR